MSIETRNVAEKNYLYTKHCSNKGEFERSSASFDSSFSYAKLIGVEFDGSEEDAKINMEMFCKTHYKNNFNNRQVLNAKSTVVVDALRSFNECKSLEKQHVRISQQPQEAHSVIISIDFNPARTKLLLRSVVYDKDVAKCTTTGFSPDKKPVVLDQKMSAHTMNDEFSIVCIRKANKTQNGMKKYQRFTVGIDTNHGAYTVVMPTEDVLGYDLATINKNRDLEGALVRQSLDLKNKELKRKENELKTRIDGIKISTHTVRQGQYAETGTWPHEDCSVHGGDVNEHMRLTCLQKDMRVMGKTFLQTHDGHTCGYNYYAYACVKL